MSIEGFEDDEKEFGTTQYGGHVATNDTRSTYSSYLSDEDKRRKFTCSEGKAVVAVRIKCQKEAVRNIYYMP